MDFTEFFRKATSSTPYPYQTRLSKGLWPSLLEIPTGLGKTAAVIVSWLYRRLEEDSDTPRRLVYCLPMRVLVEQTRDCALRWVEASSDSFQRKGLEPPSVHVLMGGEDAGDWDQFPERPAILVGTQDMLLSRTLNRGYGMSRYRWPTHFGLLNNDSLWVVDEVQLMGSGLTTTIQLQAFRQRLGVLGSAKTLWMSATADRSWFRTVDFDPEEEFKRTESLGTEDLSHPAVAKRNQARKVISQSKALMDQPSLLAQEVLVAHQERTRTLVVVNTVDRAVKLHAELRKKKSPAHLVLLHSRFRPADRKSAIEAMLASPGEEGTIVVSTQVIEAGVDVSARILFTELAPWASLVQRFGRCNRAGELSSGQVYWIDAPSDMGDKFALPYDAKEMAVAREILSKPLSDVGPASLPKIDLPGPTGHVLRRKDLLELFDTTSDLSGHDIDVSRFIRETTDFDVQVYWRAFSKDGPKPDEPAPLREELCPAPVGDLRKLLKEGKNSFRAWSWDGLSETWAPLSKFDSVFPGMTLLLEGGSGCYTKEEGWNPKSRQKVSPAAIPDRGAPSGYDNDEWAEGSWKDVATHTEEVVAKLDQLIRQLPLDEKLLSSLLEAARWHDAGKGHPAFQGKIKPNLLEECLTRPVAKAPKSAWGKGPRARFRHELASALLALSNGKEDLVAYLVAAHHGKVRLSLRSFPGEKKAPDGRRFARGVWDRDVVPAVALGGGIIVPEAILNLSLMELGGGEEGNPSWSARILGLRDDVALGPFRLAYLEALLKAADERASGGEACLP